LDVFCSCDLDLDSTTFIYELDPDSMEIYRMCENELLVSSLSKVIILHPANVCIYLCVVTFGANMNFLFWVFQKLSSDRHTYRH